MSYRSASRQRFRIRLDKDLGWIAGVCAGIARALDTDPAFIRVGAVIAALFFPKLTIAAYLIAWVFLDDDRDPDRAPWRDRER